MSRLQNLSAVLRGIGHYLPGDPVSSEVVEARVTASSRGFEMPPGIIYKLTGVLYRHFVADNSMTSADVAAEAAKSALQNAKADAETVDMMIFASASHDIAEPATANIVQEKIGCLNAHVLDVKNACNSFLNAIDLAHSLVQTHRTERVLVTSGEVLSPFINWWVRDLDDLRLKFAALTLGDGGGACLIEASVEQGRGVLPGKFYSDGRHWRLSTILSGGTLLKADMSKMYFECDSTEVQSLAARHLPELILQVVAELGWDLAEVKLAVPHQVSLRVIQHISRAISFPMEKCTVTLDRLGNTAAASIPIALSLAVEEGRVVEGDKVLLIGGAAGFSAAVVPVIW
jgi:3-oxoacyl-[acyl-carrier-protein] synthase-3